MEYKLFTTRFCHKCPSMKEFMASQENITGAVIDASTPEGLADARQFNISGVPTVVFLDNNGSEIHRSSEKEAIEQFLKKQE